jgi:hypothetical protein
VLSANLYLHFIFSPFTALMAGGYAKERRWLEEGIPICSLYLAMVRRAM